MPDQTGECLVNALINEAVERAHQLTACAGRSRRERFEGSLAAARLRYLALCYPTVADRLMLEARRLERQPSQKPLAA